MTRRSKVSERLASDPVQNLEITVNNAKKQYDKAVSRAGRAVSVLTAAQQTLSEVTGSRESADADTVERVQAQLVTAQENVERAATAAALTAAEQQTAYDQLHQALNAKLEMLMQIRVTVQQQSDELNTQSQSQTQGELATIQTDIALIEAALGDTEAKIKELKNSQGKRKRNPAPSKQPRRSSIEAKGLTKEIVAVLAEAEKVNTKKKTTTDSAARYRLKGKYRETVVPELNKKFKYKNIMQVPKVDKILLNMGLGDVKDDGKKFNAAVEELKIIAGQKPVTTTAKKSIANFKVRQGMNIGAKVTLRGDRMYEFLDKLINVALPRVRDFKGLSANSFDGRGNYAMGVKEQLIFPEIKYDKIDKVRGFDIVIVTTAKSDEEAKELLSLIGMPFKA